jgi:hypothetical protein
MMKLILALFALPIVAFAQGSTNDYLFYQKPATGPLVPRAVTPTAGRLLGWPTSINSPTAITLGTGLSLSGSTLNATASSAWADITGIPAAVTNLSGTNTGDQTITLTGDVTGSGTSTFAATIANDAVTFAKMQEISGTHLVGRHASGSGNIQEVSVGDGVEFQGSGIRRSALTGDVTASAGSNTLTLATVNSNVGSFGSATAAPAVTVNAKGLVTAVTTNTITPAVGSITGLGTGIATALAINSGTAGAPVLLNGALGTPSSGVVTNLTGTASININGTVGATTPNTGAFSSVVINGASLTAEIPNFATTSSTINYLGVKTTGTGANIAAGIFMENSTAHGILYKAGTGYGTYKNITSNDLGFYNNNIGGNISILNDHTSGNINLAAGGSSTAHLTIASTGVVNVANLTTNGVVTATSGNGTLTTVAPGTSGNVLTSNGTSWTSAAPAGGSGSGDVVGPASATDNAITRFDATTGKLIQNSGITIADGASGTLSGSNSGDITITDTDTIDHTLTGQALSSAARLQMSLTSDASGMKLVGDSASPGNSKVYGTDGSGTKGWYAAGSGSGDMTKAVYDSQNLSLISGLQGTGPVGVGGGTGGSLDMSGGNSGLTPNSPGAGSGGSGGRVWTYGGNGYTSDPSGTDYSGGVGGEINTSGADATNSASGGAGGFINTSAVGAQPGGYIDTSSNTVGGGSIDTSNGGGSINTKGVGSIELGVIATRTTLVGSATAARTITLPNVTGTVVTTGDTGSVTNTMLAGSIDLTTKVTGALPIANGGTGQTSQTNAFDALSPTTTKGDIIASNGTDNVRVPVGGTNGHVLTVDSAQATGIKWAAAAGGGADVRLYTADDTWTNPSPSTPKRVFVRMVGGGGGGGSGRKGAAASVTWGGGGGGAAAIVEFWALTTDLSSTESVVVGAGGTGGASQATNSTNGNPGVIGGDSTFGGMTAKGGNFGGAGTNAAGAGGAAISNASSIGLTVLATNAGGSSSSTIGGSATAVNPNIPTGGGGAGGLDAANNQRGGGSGGAMGVSAAGGQIAGGTNGTAATNGGNGNAGRGSGTGGGGGGSANAANAGNGGNGGGFGSGGGGGGAARDDSGDSGAGGNGAPGYILIITY